MNSYLKVTFAGHRWVNYGILNLWPTFWNSKCHCYEHQLCLSLISLVDVLTDVFMSVFYLYNTRGMQKVGLYAQKLTNRRFTVSLSSTKVVHTECGALRCGWRGAAHCLACYERVLMYAACCGILRYIAACCGENDATCCGPPHPMWTNLNTLAIIVWRWRAWVVRTSTNSEAQHDVVQCTNVRNIDEKILHGMFSWKLFESVNYHSQ